MRELDPSIHAFVISMHDKNVSFSWPTYFMQKYEERYHKTLDNSVSSRINNFDALELINEMMNSHEQRYMLYEILVVDKEAERGIDFVTNYAIFNPYKYMIKKLQNVVVDINSSSYISLMTHRVRAMRPEKYVFML